MPVIPSSYNPPFLFKNGHFSTIYAGIIRKVAHSYQKRERIDLPDGDFLDLDWSFAKDPSSKVTILIHGLEGNSKRAYITGSAKQFNAKGFDVCTMNLRGCSGETNQLLCSYHSGATEDLEAVIKHILGTQNYTEIYLKGFSLGGNLALKYLGEERDVPKEIKAAVAISVPCSLRNSQEQFLLFQNILYARRFIKNLKTKLVLKQQIYPSDITDSDLKNINTLKDFDDVYTSRAHGFKDALDYYKKCSCLQFLSNIRVPTLLINAEDDSFLGKECYPLKEAKQSKHLFLEIPKYGGHVGFYGPNNVTYTENRAIDFFLEPLNC